MPDSRLVIIIDRSTWLIYIAPKRATKRNYRKYEDCSIHCPIDSRALAHLSLATLETSCFRLSTKHRASFTTSMPAHMASVWCSEIPYGGGQIRSEFLRAMKLIMNGWISLPRESAHFANAATNRSLDRFLLESRSVELFAEIKWNRFLRRFCGSCLMVSVCLSLFFLFRQNAR